jgi:parvulin-like peptidyl-prolyl isomerase
VKRLLLVAVLGALVVGATGCDLSPPAAGVNGVTISQSALNADLSSVIDHANAQCATQLASGLTASPLGVATEDDGTTPNSVTPSFADSILQSLVLQTLEEQDLARHGVTVTPAEVTAARVDYVGQLNEQLGEEEQANTAPAGCSLSATKSVAGQLPGSFLQAQTASLAEQEQFEVLAGHLNLSTAGLEAYYRTQRTQLTQSCVDVVLSDTQAQAQSVHDAIAAGASFATESKSADVDQQQSPSGGELECEYPSEVTDQFGASLGPVVNALTTGQLTEPLALPPSTTSTGTTVTYYVVVEMRQHLLLPFASLRSSIRETILLAHDTVVKTALDHLLLSADISVDPRYGQWSVKNGVTVPTPPAPAFVLNAAANVPPPTGGGFKLNLPPAS